MRPVKLTLGLLVLVLAILIISVGVVWYSRYRTENTVPVYNSITTPYQALSQSNEDFLRAESAVLSGNFAEAETLYEKALAHAKDAVQKGQIEIKMAQLYDKEKNIPQAVDLYKKIVANWDYSNYRIVKAYSLQGMMEMYFKSGDSAVTKEIFKDSPYKEMLVNDEVDAAYRKLGEYAVSFYPLAIPELRLATWYVGDYDKGEDKSAESAAKVTARIHEAISLADEDIERTRTDVNSAPNIPTILSRKCALYLRAFESGLVQSPEAEAACKKAVETFAAVGQEGRDGYARYYYAVLLSKLGATRASDTKAVLDVYTQAGAQYDNYDVSKFFAAEKDNRLGQKARLQALAAVSEDFKKYLSRLGWNENDFSAHTP